ncbi:MAG TPA: hypothetical protein VE992_02870, partial [Solirubrobacteraceae bacterium]|nr:hypothetical protein [Solirubrobacteraceae bacterium]
MSPRSLRSKLLTMFVGAAVVGAAAGVPASRAAASANPAASVDAATPSAAQLRAEKVGLDAYVYG